MIPEGTFSVDPWSIATQELRLDLLPETETLFALSNGLIGLRGNLDEGEPHHSQGTYLNGFYETMPMPYAEGGYGYPTHGESLLNVTNGKLVRLLVDDHAFDLRYGTTLAHERKLDFREGVLERDTHWQSPTGKEIRLQSSRLVSLVHRSVAAVRFQVTAVNQAVRIVLQSTLVANEPVDTEENDPRKAAALRAPLQGLFHTHHNTYAALGHQTEVSGLRMVAGMSHQYRADHTVTCVSESETDMARVTFSTELQPGQSLIVIKFIAYGWSSVRSTPALRDQVDAALASAQRSGWAGLRRMQRDYLDTVWQGADIEIEGDETLQQALRFATFQVIQAGARAEQAAIPAKGLTARGYDGHAFWDMDTYTAPVLTYTLPEAARDVLMWRYNTLPIAKARAAELKLKGAAFAWRTISGPECSGYWPAGTAAFHINADVADAVRRYVLATGDEAFERGPGLELLVETARLWRSLGHHDAEERFRIDGITGPDEYTAIVNNNTFTNMMAARNLEYAAKVVQKYPKRAVDLNVSKREYQSWLKAAKQMVIPFDHELGITQQSAGFTRYRQWDFEKTPQSAYPLLLTQPYYTLYSSQIIKQADLVMALYLCGDRFSPEQKAKDFAYYEARTVRDSSLSAAIQAIVAAEVGHLDLAAAYFRETAYVDIRNLAGNTADGVHLAALAGAWLVAVAGFGGMRDGGDTLTFAPRMPPTLTRLAFRLCYHGSRMQVTLRDKEAHYELISGEPITFVHEGETVTLSKDQSLAFPLADLPVREPVSPPPGREPGTEGIGSNGNAPT